MRSSDQAKCSLKTKIAQWAIFYSIRLYPDNLEFVAILLFAMSHLLL